MKLLTVLMLTALPLYCYAGPGCEVLKDVIKETMDSDVKPDQFVNDFKQYTLGEDSAQGLKELKECFLEQDKETLENILKLVDAIYNSSYCAKY